MNQLNDNIQKLEELVLQLSFTLREINYLLKEKA